MNNPLITVITVCFNAEKELEATMLSVLNQSFESYEYLIIDGGSKDHTVDIIKKYEDNPHVRWISEPDKGIYDAMNKGIRMAKGEWLNMMNAGDRFASNDVLEKVFANPIPEDKTFIYSDNFWDDGKGRLVRSNKDHRIMRLLHQCCIYKRALHQGHGLYVVTPKIIVSDLLFFLTIPENEFYKTDTVISVNSKGGVSSGLWCQEGYLCAMVAFRKFTFSQMILHYFSIRIKRFLHII